MRKNTIIIVVIVVLLVAGVGWYFASPGYAMSQLKYAATSGDREDLESRIDFPAVRESLKSEVRGRLAAQLAKSDQSGFEAFGSMLAMNLVNNMVDVMVSPEGMEAMIKQGKLKRPAELAADSSEQPQVDWKIERDGLDHFRAMPVSKELKSPPALLFDREGLGWKLVGIDLPDDEVSAQ